MARIKNTCAKNLYGDGYEQEITLDNGEKYIIKNTCAKNLYGDGYEKEIVKADNAYGSESESPAANLIILIVGTIFCFLVLKFMF